MSTKTKERATPRKDTAHVLDPEAQRQAWLSAALAGCADESQREQLRRMLGQHQPDQHQPHRDTVQPDRAPNRDLLSHLHPLGEQAEFRGGIHQQGTRGAGVCAGSEDSGAEAGSMASGFADEPCGVGSAAREADAPGGADAGHFGRAGGAGEEGEEGRSIIGEPIADAVQEERDDSPSPRWLYLRTWIEAIYLDRGHGVGPICGLLGEADRTEARERFQRLLRQYRRHDERNAYCAANPDDAEADERARFTSRRFAELRDELIAWSGADAGEFVDLLGEVLEAQVDLCLTATPPAGREERGGV